MTGHLATLCKGAAKSTSVAVVLPGCSKLFLRSLERSCAMFALVSRETSLLKGLVPFSRDALLLLLTFMDPPKAADCRCWGTDDWRRLLLSSLLPIMPVMKNITKSTIDRPHVHDYALACCQAN